MAGKVAAYVRRKVDVIVHVLMIDTHQTIPEDFDEGVDTPMVVERLLGNKHMVTSATRKRFRRNVSLMKSWVVGKQLGVLCEDATVIEAGESNAEDRRVKVANESTFYVSGADHFSILKWPYVLNVVAVTQSLLGKERFETRERIEE